MKAIVKNTGEQINVEPQQVSIDEMTSYFVYVNKETKEQYKYSDLKFE